MSILVKYIKRMGSDTRKHQLINQLNTNSKLIVIINDESRVSSTEMMNRVSLDIMFPPLGAKIITEDQPLVAGRSFSSSKI